MQEDLELKLFAAVRFCRLVMPQMKERKWGRIINVLNIGAKAPRAASAPTSVSRAAGMALTKVLASEDAPYNILVNALLVGLIDADQHVQKAKSRGISLDEYKAPLAKDVPMGRFGRAEEFANMACFLASDAGRMSPAPRSTSTADARRWSRDLTPRSRTRARARRQRPGSSAAQRRGTCAGLSAPRCSPDTRSA